MATVRGILGQLQPSAGSLEDLYTVPANKDATVRVIIANLIGAATLIRISVAPAGASDSDEQYLAKDLPIAENDVGSTIAFTLNETDVVRCYSLSGEVAFNCTGIETDKDS